MIPWTREPLDGFISIHVGGSCYGEGVVPMRNRVSVMDLVVEIGVDA